MLLSPCVGPASALVIEYCTKAPRVNCIVDGDTLWLGGEKIRLAGIDAPEPRGGCPAERDIAARSAERLRQLVSDGGWKLERQGTDRYGRTLAVLRTATGTIGQQLVAEGLAKTWQGHKARWCD